uniref:Uncharacterized protein n=1 Tax=Vespula pensylvanica TaxID=30213 RepID=A0A834UET1_VESPE|nr:hypothetical protein H0235_003560 [Vespula pensylvanica]
MKQQVIRYTWKIDYIENFEITSHDERREFQSSSGRKDSNLHFKEARLRTEDKEEKGRGRRRICETPNFISYNMQNNFESKDVYEAIEGRE